MMPRVHNRWVGTAAIALVLWAAVLRLTAAGDLETFTDVRLIKDASNDADSFRAEMNGNQYILRLYFVDAPETTAASAVDARRVREQTRYFGLPAAERTIHYGREAAEFVEQLLSERFTVHTAFASALGRAAEGRIYAFVTTADGKDLAETLVRHGYARAVGMGRRSPDDVHRDDLAARLRDLELSAAINRRGIWSETDPDRLVELRGQQRHEEREIAELRRTLTAIDEPINVNAASLEELQRLPGIGPVTAQRIIDERPYDAVEELLDVPGIGPVRLEQIRAFVVVNGE